jgi:hypothetical protein
MCRNYPGFLTFPTRPLFLDPQTLFQTRLNPHKKYQLILEINPCGSRQPQ